MVPARPIRGRSRSDLGHLPAGRRPRDSSSHLGSELGRGDGAGTKEEPRALRSQAATPWISRSEGPATRAGSLAGASYARDAMGSNGRDERPGGDPGRAPVNAGHLHPCDNLNKIERAQPALSAATNALTSGAKPLA